MDRFIIKRSKRTMSGVSTETLDQSGHWYAEGANGAFESIPEACKFYTKVKDKDGKAWIENTETGERTDLN